MPRKKTWTEKLDSPRPHQVKVIHHDFAGLKRGQNVLIPSPKLVDQLIRDIPPGTDVDPKTLRAELAEQTGAEATCPVTLGIQLRTVAEAAYEAFERGADIDEVTPIWRVLDETSPTLAKLSYDPEFILRMRQREGLASRRQP